MDSWFLMLFLPSRVRGVDFMVAWDDSASDSPKSDASAPGTFLSGSQHGRGIASEENTAFSWCQRICGGYLREWLGYDLIQSANDSDILGGFIGMQQYNQQTRVISWWIYSILWQSNMVCWKVAHLLRWFSQRTSTVSHVWLPECGYLANSQYVSPINSLPDAADALCMD